MAGPSQAAAEPPRRRVRWWHIYAVLLAASYLVQMVWPRSADVAIMSESGAGETRMVQVPRMASAGPVDGEMTIATRYFAGPEGSRRVLLLHGSPGAGRDFDRLSKLLHDADCTVIAPDLPGFGGSIADPPSLSSLAHARAVLAMLDRMGADRVHVVGWSLGGAVALHMADLDPARVASITLMASVSEQATEGSGSYAFEHAKYAAGYAVAAGARHLVPHFGLLSGLELAERSMRNFWDTDMRPLAGIMRRLRTPTLILHGRHDFLVPDWAAQRSYDMIPTASLVVLDASHFLPILQPRETAAHLLNHFARHDEPGVPALRQVSDYAPVRGTLLGGPGERVIDAVRATPWWVLLLVIAAAVAVRNRCGAVGAALLISFGLVDFGLGLAGVILGLGVSAGLAFRRGRVIRRRGERPRVLGSGVLARTPEDWAERLRERPIAVAISTRFVPGEHALAWRAAGLGRRLSKRFAAGAAAGWALWAVFYVVFTLIAAVWAVHPLAERFGVWGLLAGIVIALNLPRPLELVLTRQGRRDLRRSLARARRLEYWPAWALYVPLAPWYTYWGLRYSPLAFTCCNPAIGGGGGVIGESKWSILRSLGDGDGAVLPAAFIGAGPEPAARGAAALREIGSRPELGGFPVILKPDSGYRGFAVRLARGPEDVLDYFRTVLGPALVQRFHTGPHECGILWARREGDAAGRGFIFSITRKEFPVLTGDGRRTLEDLIYAHPRFHRQAGVFLERLAAQRRRVPGAGEIVRLAQTGNHCQGTLFRDGEDLITPALETRIDRIARGFAQGLDIGRFDLRFESEEALRYGRGFAIVELNGTTGESTNMYDPDRSVPWALGVLVRQWRLMYRLGAARQRAGARPLGAVALLRALRAHYKTRTGSALAD